MNKFACLAIVFFAVFSSQPVFSQAAPAAPATPAPAAKPATPPATPAVAPAPVAPPGPKKLKIRIGEVLSAELSLRVVPVLNRSKFDVASYKKPVYAIVFFRPDKGRSLGVYDFALVSAANEEFPCVGVREGDAQFDASKWEIENCDPAKIYSMCFIVDIPTFAKDQDIKFTLRHKLLPNLAQDVKLDFRNLFDQAFAVSAAIPPEGNLGVKPPPPAPPPAPAKPATPATPAPAKPANK